MGLDMFLEKEIFIGANYAHRKVEGDINITIDGEKADINFKKVSSIIERVAYWRKANQVHNWFVKNIQGGEDDCCRYYVSGEKLKELLEVCKRVLKDNTLAQILLPTESGCFFGSTEYGDDYFFDLEITVEQLEKLNTGDYYYTSSW